jgi:hypothetical protein
MLSEMDKMRQLTIRGGAEKGMRNHFSRTLFTNSFRSFRRVASVILGTINCINGINLGPHEGMMGARRQTPSARQSRVVGLGALRRLWATHLTEQNGWLSAIARAAVLLWPLIC